MNELIELIENLIKKTNDQERPILWKSSEANEDEFYISHDNYTIMIRFSPLPLKSYTITIEKTEDSLSETISIYEDEYLYNKIHKLFLSIRNSKLLKKLKKADLIEAIKNINHLLMNPDSL